MTIWHLHLDNFEGRDDTYFFTNESAARTTFNAIADAYSYCDEFEKQEDKCSWFDADYNEYSTYVWLEAVDEDTMYFDEPILSNW